MIKSNRLQETLAAQLSCADTAGLLNVNQTVADIMYFAPALDETATGATLLEYFSRPRAAEGVVIVRHGYPLGLVAKLDFVKAYANRAVNGDRGALPWSAWCVKHPLMCDAMEPIDTLAECSNRLGDAPLPDVFAVTCNGRYAGLGSGAALRRIRHLCTAAAMQRHLALVEQQLPLQQQADFLARARLQRHLPDHGYLHRPRQDVSGTGVAVRAFERGVALAVLSCEERGQPCAATQLSVLGWLESQLHAMPADAQAVDPAELIVRMHRFLRSDRRSPSPRSDRQPRREGRDVDEPVGVRAAVVWLPREGQSMCFAGASMGLTLLRAHTREFHHVAGACFMVGHGATPDDAGLQTHTVELDGDFRVAIVASGLIAQVGGPFNEPMGQAVLNHFFKRHASLSAADLTLALDDHLQTWLAGRPQQTDIAALVFSAGARYASR